MTGWISGPDGRKIVHGKPPDNVPYFDDMTSFWAILEYPYPTVNKDLGRQPCCRTLPFQEGFHIWGNKGQLEGFKSIFLSQMYGLQNILDQKLTNIC